MASSSSSASPAQPLPTYRYRAAHGPSDAQLVLNFFDSSLAYLARIGSGAQWGDQRFSERPGSVARVQGLVAQSDATFAKAIPFSEKKWSKCFFAERRLTRQEAEQAHIQSLLKEAAGNGSGKAGENESDDEVWLPVAAMLLCSRPCDYLASIWPDQDDSDPFLFLRYLISDHRAGALSKGAAASLLTFARKEAEGLGLRRICGDCWNGNNRKLVK